MRGVSQRDRLWGGLELEGAEVEGLPAFFHGFDGERGLAGGGELYGAEFDLLVFGVVAGLGGGALELLIADADLEGATAGGGDLSGDVELAGLGDLELPVNPIAGVDPEADVAFAAVAALQLDFAAVAEGFAGGQGEGAVGVLGEGLELDVGGCPGC